MIRCAPLWGAADVTNQRASRRTRRKRHGQAPRLGHEAQRGPDHAYLLFQKKAWSIKYCNEYVTLRVPAMALEEALIRLHGKRLSDFVPRSPHQVGEVYSTHNFQRFQLVQRRRLWDRCNLNLV